MKGKNTPKEFGLAPLCCAVNPELPTRFLLNTAAHSDDDADVNSDQQQQQQQQQRLITTTIQNDQEPEDDVETLEQATL